MSTSIPSIAIVGPESSGKTTLAQALGRHYQCQIVSEFAREYLQNLDRPYHRADLLTIARGQLQLEQKVADTQPPKLICDTNLLEIKVWSLYKYQQCDPWIVEAVDRSRYDLHLLCLPDLPWQFDPLRENPSDRMVLFEMYHEQLLALNFPFDIIEGNGAERMNKALNAIERIP